MKKIIIIGGNGALGKSVVRLFMRYKWTTVVLDLSENKEASSSVKLPLSIDTTHVDGLRKNLPTVDMVVNVAGGWEGVSSLNSGSIASLRKMTDMNVSSSLLALTIAETKLNDRCPVVLTGALGVKDDIPDFMLTYGLAKQSVHSLVEHVKNKRLLGDKRIHCLLPSTIDTPMNRKSMPDADYTTWTTPDKIADRIYSLIDGDNDLFIKV